MWTVGVDLAAEAANTALACVGWAAGGAKVSEIAPGAALNALVALD